MYKYVFSIMLIKIRCSKIKSCLICQSFIFLSCRLFESKQIYQQYTNKKLGHISVNKGQSFF